MVHDTDFIVVLNAASIASYYVHVLFCYIQEYFKVLRRLQHNTDVEELLSSDDSNEGRLITFNRVNEIIVKWENNPSKQPYMADLKRLRDIVITVAQVYIKLDSVLYIVSRSEVIMAAVKELHVNAMNIARCQHT